MHACVCVLLTLPFLCSLFSAIGWLSQLPMVSKLPAAHIRAIASAVWLRRGQDNLELHLSQDTFRCECVCVHACMFVVWFILCGYICITMHKYLLFFLVHC